MAASGCTHARYDHAQLVADVAANDPGLRADFAPGDAILSGFDDVVPRARWRVGDRVLYGFHVHDTHQETVRFIEVELRSGVLSPGTQVIVGSPPAEDESQRDEGASQVGGDRQQRRVVYVPPLEADGSDTGGKLVVRGWSMTMTLGDPAGPPKQVTRTSQAVVVAIRVYDEKARLLKVTYALAPERYLRKGFFTACRQAVAITAAGRKVTAGECEAVADLFPSLYAIGEMVGTTPNLDELLRRVMPRPTVLSFLLNAGVRISVRGDLNSLAVEDRPLPGLGGGRTAYRFPIDLEMNKEAVMRCVMIVSAPQSPYTLCGGVVGLEGAQIQNPSKRFVMRLLAARRGVDTMEGMDGGVVAAVGR